MMGDMTYIYYRDLCLEANISPDWYSPVGMVISPNIQVYLPPRSVICTLLDYSIAFFLHNFFRVSNEYFTFIKKIQKPGKLNDKIQNKIKFNTWQNP
jgi:hypothetical protein